MNNTQKENNKLTPNYVLVYSDEEEVSVKAFITLEAAQKKMEAEYEEITDHDEENSGIALKSAWVFDGPNHQNYRWDIMDIGSAEDAPA